MGMMGRDMVAVIVVVGNDGGRPGDNLTVLTAVAAKLTTPSAATKSRSHIYDFYQRDSWRFPVLEVERMSGFLFFGFLYFFFISFKPISIFNFD